MGGGCTSESFQLHDETTLGHFLAELDHVGEAPMDNAWQADLLQQVESGKAFMEQASEDEQRQIRRLFDDWVRTEELKAWYGEPENNSLFQGTSVSSLTIPAEFSEPLTLNSIVDLEDMLAERYIELHDQHEASVKGAIVEDTSKWRSEGLYYGVVIASKMISQAFGLAVNAADVVFEVDGYMVDPHEITTYPADIRRKYFEMCREQITCFSDIANLTQTELETSLVLADISKPRIDDYHEQILLAPIRCNEICSLISRHVCEMIEYKTGGRIRLRSLSVTIYDTDTPYTYHQIVGYYGQELAPTLPGLIVLGTSGTIDAFRWLYAYRVSLISQKMMKSSLYSEVARRFVPFVYFGVLVERDAEILLDMDRLSDLRYRGNLSPFVEYTALIGKLRNYLEATSDNPFDEELGRLRAE